MYLLGYKNIETKSREEVTKLIEGCGGQLFAWFLAFVGALIFLAMLGGIKKGLKGKNNDTEDD